MLSAVNTASEIKMLSEGLPVEVIHILRSELTSLPYFNAFSFFTICLLRLYLPSLINYRNADFFWGGGI